MNRVMAWLLPCDLGFPDTASQADQNVPLGSCGYRLLFNPLELLAGGSS